jgi:hypothetical protein
VHTIDVLVVALDSVELQPRDATHAVRAKLGVLGRSALDGVWSSLHVAVVALWGSEIEHGNLFVGEVVVARGTLVGFFTDGDGVLESEVCDLGEDVVVEACSIACCIEESGLCAVGYRDDVC